MSLLIFARNFPLLGGMYVLNFPFPFVAVVSTHFQEPFFCFWIATGTNEPQAALPFVTLTWPDTRLFCWKPNEIVRATGPVVTVKS